MENKMDRKKIFDTFKADIYDIDGQCLFTVKNKNPKKDEKYFRQFFSEVGINGSY
jgi:hypothetical protein